MFFDFKVKVPEGTKKICYKKIKDTVYVNYEYDRIYIKEKKYTNVKRTTIGKLCADDEGYMYPNPNFIKYFPDAELPGDEKEAERSSCLHVGTYMVLEKLLKELQLDDIISQFYDERGCGPLLDLASYLIITEGNAAQYYPDYAYNHPLFTPNQKIYSDSTVSRFLSEMSAENSMRFQNEWNKTKKHDEKIYISYDSTNKCCDAGDVEFREVGHSKDEENEPNDSNDIIVNIGVAYDAKNKDPLFYEEYPGSINDAMQLQMMLEKASDYGYEKAAFILDRGCFSRSSLRYMDAHGYDYIIMLKAKKDLVSETAASVKNTFEEKRTCYIPRYHVYAASLEIMFSSDEKNKYIHIFYNAKKAAAEKEELESKLEKMAKYLKKMEGKKWKMDKAYQKYFIPEYAYQGTDDECFACARERAKVIEKEMSLCGYFCIVTSEKMKASEAYELYKSRDYSEKLFAADKSFLGSKKARVYSSESFSGKLFIEFVALILRNKMYAKLKDALEEMPERPNYMNVPAAIRELEKIEMICGDGKVYRLNYALTANQKTVLKAFGIDAAYVKKKTESIRNRLNPENVVVKITQR